MLHALWASDCCKPWTVWDTRTTSRGELMHPPCVVWSGWKSLSHTHRTIGLNMHYNVSSSSEACAFLQLFMAAQALKDPLNTFKSAFSICVWVVWVVCWSWLNSHFFTNWRHPFCRRCVWSFALWICAREHDISMRAVNLIRWSFVRWSSSSISGGHVLYAPPGRRL